MGRTGFSAFEAGRALLAQRKTEALLPVIDDASVLITGLPVDRYDDLVVVGAESVAHDPDTRSIPGALSMIAPHCTGNALFASRGLMRGLRQNLLGSVKPRVITSREDLLVLVSQRIAMEEASKYNLNGEVS